MKFILSVFLIVSLPSLVWADAGPNIGRPKAPCYAEFTGLDKLQNYDLFKTINRRNGRIDEIDSTNKITDGEKVRIYYEKGEKRWHGPITIFVRDKITNLIVDSLILNAEGHNLNINFTPSENGKPTYIIIKTKAEYPYQLFGTDEPNDVSTARRNKYILIALSGIGFLILLFMFFKRNSGKSEPNQIA